MSPVDKRSIHWRSLDELDARPAFLNQLSSEFPEGASDGRQLSRRRVLQLMGASVALAAASGCWKEDTIVPPALTPGHADAGVLRSFATAMEVNGVAAGLLVTSYEGRPIKIEGNPLHPESLGGASAGALASTLELYDPDRSRGVLRRGQASSWEAFADAQRPLFAAHRAARRGAGLRVLSESTSSHTLHAQRRLFLEAFPEARWHSYEPLGREQELEGARLAFGRALRTRYDLTKADVIAAFDADLLGTHPAALRHTREFAARRKPSAGTMVRLYAVEGMFSITGANADHRLAARSSDVAALLETLTTEVAERMHAAPLASSASAGPTRSGRTKFIRALADDLVASRGRGIVAVGERQPAAVHAAAHRLNALLNNAGEGVVYTDTATYADQAPVEPIESLAVALDRREVSTLLILGGNPVYDAPADLRFPQKLDGVDNAIHLSLYANETSRRCGWHLPRAHFMEAWDDARAWDGTHSIVQPLIDPLYKGKTPAELLAQLRTGSDATAYDLVREMFRAVYPQGTEQQWQQSLNDGIVKGTQYAVLAPTMVTSAEMKVTTPTSDRAGSLEIAFYADGKVLDGRFANNGWLQELPDFITKLTWDNAALLSPATAKSLGIEHETLVRLKYRGRALDLPAYVMPGIAPSCVAVALGYGRTAAGQVGGHSGLGVRPVGFDAYALRTVDSPYFDTGLTIEPLNTPFKLAITQTHHAIDAAGQQGIDQRLDQLVRETSLAHYREEPDFAKGEAGTLPMAQLWDAFKYDGHRWGMAVDLNACTGCNACVTACQAENNVPIVGKEQVINGREMHWIRVDRYFKGDREAPESLAQPVMCMQCENAPCEQVCPVAATVHSSEGLNDMVYNRCIGTRYCSNNCPYKVRRFNFFDYHKALGDPVNEINKLVFNPDVTVRMRGVMEKCTFCVQRIQRVKIAARNEQRPVVDGEIVPACAQACPAEAIVFGDLGDKNSAVARLHADARSYGLLDELNVRPRVAYLAKIRNPHPALQGDVEEQTP